MRTEIPLAGRLVAVMSALVLSFLCAVSASAAPVAFVQAAQSSNDLSRVIRVTRAGRVVAIRGRYLDLEAGDEITLRHSRAQVVVRYLGNNATHWVKRKAGAAKPDGPDYRVEAPRVASLPQAVFSWLVSQFVGNPAGRDTHEITASSRSTLPGGGCAGSDGPVALRSLGEGPLRLAAGRRAIAVQWEGGLAPYKVAVVTDGNGLTTAPATNECGLRLPVSDLEPGAYVLELRDSNKPEPAVRLLEVVAARPKMPEALRDATLDDVSRQLYYASWLRALDGGAWALEAQQIVVAQDCRHPAVLEWLDNAGLDPVCAADGTGAAE